MISITDLYDTICQRRDNPPANGHSYTSSLLEKGEDEILKKIGEEAIEVILAAKGQGNQRVIEELADLTYHVLVLLASRHLPPADILTELDRRHQ